MKLAVPLTLLLPALAVADEPRRVAKADLGDLFWSAAASCQDRADDVLRRQCRALADARGRAWAGGTYVIRLDSTGPVVRGCLACREPVIVAGEPRYVVTRGSVSDGPDGLVAPELAHLTTPPGPVDLVFRLPATPEAWSQGDKRGFFVEALAWHATDPVAAAPVAPVAPALPEQLTAEQIKASMAPVAKEVDICFESHGVPGTADLGFEVGGDGVVKHVEIRGELEGTPTAGCISEAVKKASFPKFSRTTMWIHYPFILR